MPANEKTLKTNQVHREAKRKGPPEVFQVVIECRDEAQQRELYERLKGEGVKVRLLVL